MEIDNAWAFFKWVWGEIVIKVVTYGIIVAGAIWGAMLFLQSSYHVDIFYLGPALLFLVASFLGLCLTVINRKKSPKPRWHYVLGTICSVVAIPMFLFMMLRLSWDIHFKYCTTKTLIHWAGHLVLLCAVVLLLYLVIHLGRRLNVLTGETKANKEKYNSLIAKLSQYKNKEATPQ
jgi:hypothetical protein